MAEKWRISMAGCSDRRAVGMATVLKKALSGLYYGLSPLARRILPKPVLRFLLLNVVGVNHPYAEILGNPGRLFMEQELLPWLRERYRRILFVGTASYAWHYEKLFDQDPDQYTTLDSRPGAAVWGAPTHIVARIEDIGRHRPGEFFDCIVFNGVFGFGIDSPVDMRAAAKAMHDALRPGGVLIVGWNTDLHADPEELGVLSPHFARTDQTPWGQTRRYPAELHVYDFYVKSPRETPTGR